MDAYPMFRRCWAHQPDNKPANQDEGLWKLFQAERLVSNEPEMFWPNRGVLPEAGSRYPEFYPLDETVVEGVATFV